MDMAQKGRPYTSLENLIVDLEDLLFGEAIGNSGQLVGPYTSPSPTDLRRIKASARATPRIDRDRPVDAS